MVSLVWLALMWLALLVWLAVVGVWHGPWCIAYCSLARACLCLLVQGLFFLRLFGLGWQGGQTLPGLKKASCLYLVKYLLALGDEVEVGACC